MGLARQLPGVHLADIVILSLPSLKKGAGLKKGALYTPKWFVFQ
jgi:hypothetical protein